MLEKTIIGKIETLNRLTKEIKEAQLKLESINNHIHMRETDMIIYRDKSDKCRNEYELMEKQEGRLREKIEQLEGEIEQLELAIHQKQTIIAETEEKIEIIAAKYDLLMSAEEAAQQKRMLDKEIVSSNDKLAELKDQILIVSDAVEFETFGLYEPKYSFISSAEYKMKLDDVRRKQKQMIKDKTAWHCYHEWTVNNSRAAGIQATNEIGKTAIRAFNESCEAVISTVKFSNFDRCLSRLERTFDIINNTNSTMSIYIAYEYKDLKIEELHIAYEYQRKKQEEKDKIREQREIDRENAIVKKELEEEKKRIEKEQNHYENQVERLKEQFLYETDDDRRRELDNKIGLLLAHLDDLNEKIKAVDYREANERAGYVYVISNIGSFGENVYKIGMTRRLEPMDRIDELGNASVPFKFDVHAMIFSDDAPSLETSLHNAFSQYKVNMINGRKEFFKVPLERIKEEIEKHKEITAEFHDLPLAQQYRESKKIWENKHINDQPLTME